MIRATSNVKFFEMEKLDRKIIRNTTDKSTINSKAYYFTMTASRPDTVNRIYYNNLMKELGLGSDFPHDQPIHSGVCIMDKDSAKVELVLEGYPNKDGHLYLVLNRKTTVIKLENSKMPVRDSEGEVSYIEGDWHKAYQLKLHFLSDDTAQVEKVILDFFAEFNLSAQNNPVKYRSFQNDCQTVTHYIIHKVLNRSLVSPHTTECTRGWLDGTKSPQRIHQEWQLLDMSV